MCCWQSTFKKLEDHMKMGRITCVISGTTTNSPAGEYSSICRASRFPIPQGQQVIGSYVSTWSSKWPLRSLLATAGALQELISLHEDILLASYSLFAVSSAIRHLRLSHLNLLVASRLRGWRLRDSQPLTVDLSASNMLPAYTLAKSALTRIKSQFSVH